MKRLEQRGGEATRTAQPGARRDVGHARQFEVASRDAHQLEGLADDRMLDVVQTGHPFQFGVLQNQLGHEGFVEGDIDVFVDGRGQQEAPEALVVTWQIGATAAQADAQRGSGDDHAAELRRNPQTQERQKRTSQRHASQTGVLRIQDRFKKKLANRFHSPPATTHFQQDAKPEAQRGKVG